MMDKSMTECEVGTTVIGPRHLGVNFRYRPTSNLDRGVRRAQASELVGLPSSSPSLPPPQAAFRISQTLEPAMDVCICTT